MRPSTSLDVATLGPRLDSIRQALGATRIAVARRRSGLPGEVGGLEVVAAHPHADPIESVLPLDLFGRMMRSGVDLQLRPASESAAWERSARRLECAEFRGFVYPRDGRPSVYFAASLQADQLDARREVVARAGMEALARLLAPPSWLPLGSPPRAQSDLPLAFEGESAWATSMRERAKGTASGRALELVVGPEGSGRREVARWLLGRGELATPPRIVDEQELRSGQTRGAWIVQLEDLGAPLQAKLLDAGFVAGPGILLGGPGLEREVSAGRVRSDLYWSLWPERWELPSLAARMEDLVPLWQRAYRDAKGPSLRLDLSAREAVAAHPWRGQLSQLRAHALRLARSGVARGTVDAETLALPDVGPISTSMVPDGVVPLEEALRRVEHTLLVRALQASEGNKSRAARQLRLSRQGLYRKLHRHGLLRASPDLDTDASNP